MSRADHIVRDYHAQDRRALLDLVESLQEFERVLRAKRRMGADMAAERVDVMEGAIRSGVGRVLLAERGGIAIAFTALKAGTDDLDQERREMWIEDLFVVDGERGRGVGRSLVRAAEAHARALGISRVVIGTLHANNAAQAAYRALGYEPAVLILEREVGLDD